MSRLAAPLVLFVAAAVLAACTPHRVEVRQGNYLTQELVDQLEVGMSRDQVRYLFGTPIAQSPFRDARWDYVYSRERQGLPDEYAYLVVWFDGEVVERYEVRDAPSS